MATYLSPGVYIEEVPSGPQPIAAVSPSVLAIVGTTHRGPYMDPTRVTGWGEYVDRFGGAVPGLFTAEAVSGFFENGGAAAYIVRVDPSAASVWLARDEADADVFRITASSPGAWSNGLSVVITPSMGGGLARAWTSTVAATAADQVTVVSTAGLRIGDTIQDAGATSAVVTSIAGTDVGLDSNPAWPDGTDIFVVQDAATVALASASGIEVDDLIVIEEPGQTPRYATVTGITEQPGGGFVVDLAAATSVPGGAEAPRTAWYPAVLNAANLTQVQLTQLDLTNSKPTAAEMADGYRAELADGRIAEWDTDHFELPDGSTFPTGDVNVQAGIRVAMYAESGLSLDNPTLDELANLYGWVPDGMRLVLSSGGDAEIVKSGATFTLDSGSLAATFANIEFDPDGGTDALVTAAHAPAVGDALDLGGGADTIQAVTHISGDRYQIGLTIAPTAGSDDLVVAFQQTRIVPYRFGMTVSDGTLAESFANLALAEGHPRYYARDGIINDSSSLVTVGPRIAAGAIDETTMPVQVAVSAAGTTGTATAQDLIDGIDELEREAEPAILVCPDLLALDDPALQGAVVGAMTGHAEDFRRFAVIDTPRESNDQDLVDWRLEHVNSIYGAAYAPHVRILNLDSDSPERFRFVPPSGVVAGVFARTDRERGVHKAPANERVRGIVGLDEDYTQRRQDLLNPNGVNLIRSFPGRGRRIWGARNATDDTTWRYVNVRRLFNVIETSVERGTQWVVFEPNTASTWLRVRVSVENFLNGLWAAGALAGNSPDEAYRVRVGLGETMTEAQIDLGLIIVQVAVAPAKPAEFVVFQFTHKRLTE